MTRNVGVESIPHARYYCKNLDESFSQILTECTIRSCILNLLQQSLQNIQGNKMQRIPQTSVPTVVSKMNCSYIHYIGFPGRNIRSLKRARYSFLQQVFILFTSWFSINLIRLQVPEQQQGHQFHRRGYIRWHEHFTAAKLQQHLADQPERLSFPKHS